MESGFRRWETASDGTRYRSIAGHASFFVPADAKAIVIPARTTFADPEDPPVEISIAIDDRLADAFVLRDGSWKRARFVYPHRAAGGFGASTSASIASAKGSAAPRSARSPFSDDTSLRECRCDAWLFVIVGVAGASPLLSNLVWAAVRARTARRDDRARPCRPHSRRRSQPAFLPLGLADAVRLRAGSCLASAVRRVLGLDPALSFSELVVSARATVALAGTLTVVVVYVAGRRMGGAVTGLLAALFLAVAILHVRESHFAMTDALMTLLLTASLALLLEATRTDRKRAGSRMRGGSWLPGFAGGLAAATKYSAAAVLAAMGAAQLLLLVRDRSRMLSLAGVATERGLRSGVHGRLRHRHAILHPGLHAVRVGRPIRHHASVRRTRYQSRPRLVVPPHIFAAVRAWHSDVRSRDCRHRPSLSAAIRATRSCSGRSRLRSMRRLAAVRRCSSVTSCRCCQCCASRRQSSVVEVASRIAARAHSLLLRRRLVWRCSSPGLHSSTASGSTSCCRGPTHACWRPSG